MHTTHSTTNIHLDDDSPRIRTTAGIDDRGSYHVLHVDLDGSEMRVFGSATAILMTLADLQKGLREAADKMTDLDVHAHA